MPKLTANFQTNVVRGLRDPTVSIFVEHIIFLFYPILLGASRSTKLGNCFGTTQRFDEDLSCEEGQLLLWVRWSMDSLKWLRICFFYENYRGLSSNNEPWSSNLERFEKILRNACTVSTTTVVLPWLHMHWYGEFVRTSENGLTEFV